MAVDFWRERLSKIGRNVLDYHRDLDKLGYSCCFYRSRWFYLNFNREDWACHIRYLAEYAAEALLLQSDSVILFDDEYKCRSEFLQSLKEARYNLYGPVKSILGRSETSHLVELSPCYREYSRIRQARDAVSVAKANRLQSEFLDLKDKEMQENRMVSGALNSLPINFCEGAIQEFYCGYIFKSLMSYGSFFKAVIKLGFEEEHVVYCQLNDGSAFIIRPTVSFGGEESGSGSMGLGFLIAEKNAMSSSVYRRDQYSNLNISSLFPEKLGSYGFFRSREEFCLNVLAFSSALNVVIGDILRSLEIL